MVDRQGFTFRSFLEMTIPQTCNFVCERADQQKGFGVFLHLEGQNQTDKGSVDIAYLHVSTVDLW